MGLSVRERRNSGEPELVGGSNAARSALATGVGGADEGDGRA
jgi:hypothetical protein